MAETTIRPAFDAQNLAGPLIEAHHEHLQGARVLWLFTTSKRTRGGHVTLGTAARSNPLQRFLSSGNDSVQTGHDYIVQIDEGRWKRALATQRAALVDHLLCRMVQREVNNKRTGEITRSWGTVGPDIEEFSDVILRHGVWLPEQQVMAKAMREQGNTIKLKLPDLQDEPTEEAQPKDRGAEHITTVDPDGIVVASEQIDQTPEPAHTNGAEHEPGWQEATGVGASEHEQRRRRRGPHKPEDPTSA